MKMMVCLISQQHVPNLLAVQAIKPDRLVLLVTPGMKERRKDLHLLRALAAGGRDYSTDHEVVDITDENSVEAVYRALEEVMEPHPNDEWIVNLTGGTKPMSMGAYVFSRERGLKTLYIAESNQQRAIDLLGGAPVALDHHVSTAEFLAGYGFDLQNPHQFDEVEKNARGWLPVAALLTANHDDRSVRCMLDKLQNLKERRVRESPKAWEREGLTFSENDDISLNDPTLRAEIAREFGLKEAGRKLAGSLSKQAVQFLTGRWLEVFVWGLLLPFEGDAIWDLHLGVVAGGKEPGGSNEFDVSFMHDQSFCIVECKTGDQKHDHDANAALYKIEAVKASLMAIRLNIYLATTSPNVVDKETGNVKVSIANRCRLYNCRIIHGKPLREMAKMFLENDPSLQGCVAATFHLKHEMG